MASNDHLGNKTAKELILHASKLLDKHIESKGEATFHDWLTILAILTINETSYDVADFWAKAFDVWHNKARENAEALVSKADMNSVKTGNINHNTDNSRFDEEQRLNKEQKKTEKPMWKFYQDVAYEAANEETRCLMMRDILNARREYYAAQNKYFDTVSQIYRANETYKFDLYV